MLCNILKLTGFEMQKMNNNINSDTDEIANGADDNDDYFQEPPKKRQRLIK